MSRPPRDYHNPPQPDFSVVDKPKTLDAEDIYRQYAPHGRTSEPILATAARIAHRLIDRITGKTYSADELEEKILSQVDTTIIELDAAPVNAVPASVNTSITAPDTSEYGQIIATAVTAGAAGNAITIEIAEGPYLGPLTVDVVGSAITVTIDFPDTTSAMVVDAVNGDTEASALVSLVNIPGIATSQMRGGVTHTLTGGSEGTAGVLGQIVIADTNAHICVRQLPALWKIMTPE